MDGIHEDYNSFEQYNYNHDVYEKIKIDILNEYYSFPGDILRGYTEYKDSITRDCSRLRKYLTYFGSEKDCKNKNCCQYINYFLNQRIHKDYHSNQSIFDIYKTYMNHEYNSTIKNLCLTEINYMNQEKYNKIHELYNAYKMCKFYVSNKHDGMSCNRAKLCANKYNNIMTKYTKRDDTKFCKILKDLKDYLEQNEPISTGNCNSRFSNLLLYPHECDELLQKAEKLDVSMVQTNGRLVVQGEVKGATPQEQREGTPGVGVPGVGVPGVGVPGVGVPGYGTGVEGSSTLKDTQSYAEDINSKTPNDNTTIPVGTITYTSLGLVLPLVTLYKYTPLGTWVNTKILGRNKLMENMRKNNYELLLNDVGKHEASLNDPMYHIRYNSATNH
ncbi:PIR protein [Plasmodium vivax]|uniref:VIR protein n=1 Tax=Plasmodium vivax TaxID=5855 RepID=A0A565A4M0_PLAVI|nr:PIR protein [Plasmodium vivax]